MNLHKLLRSFGHASQGIVTACKTEQNFRIHLLAAVIVMIVSFFSSLSRLEWTVVILLVSGMFMIELINTAIERVVDLISPDYHPLAKQAKDLAAAACLVYAVATIIIGSIIFLPKWLVLLN